MQVVLKHEVNRAKNGYCASAYGLGLAAYGISPEVAKQNLERTILLLLQPFQRQGVLEQELASIPVEIVEDDAELSVVAL